MKLTNTLRDAFVRSAMNDVPQVDYRQQIRDLPPDEAAANRSLPVVANVVAEFVQAGWPKEKVA